MNIETKHKISRQIVASLSKISYYRETINKILKNNNSFYEATLHVRLVGIRSTIWENLSALEVVSILKKRMKQEQELLTTYENKIK